MSPILNRASRAWSARNGSRVLSVAARHTGLIGRCVDGIPTTGITPALAVVTKVFKVNPLSMSKAPVRAHRDRTVRRTSHRIAHDSQSQIVGYCIHAN